MNFTYELKLEILYLLVPDSSVSNIILNRMPRDNWLLQTAFWYLAKGITNSEGLVLKGGKNNPVETFDASFLYIL